MSLSKLASLLMRNEAQTRFELIVEAKKESLPAEHGLQQARGYRVGKLHHVPFVFSSNGHQFVEYDEETGITSEARPLSEFPKPDELLERYLAVRRLLPTSPALAVLSTRYEKGREFLRYYQDAAIRAALEQVAHHIDNQKPPRVMLPLSDVDRSLRLATSGHPRRANGSADRYHRGQRISPSIRPHGLFALPASIRRWRVDSNRDRSAKKRSFSAFILFSGCGAPRAARQAK